jgi:hypothetical protein
MISDKIGQNSSCEPFCSEKLFPNESTVESSLPKTIKVKDRDGQTLEVELSYKCPLEYKNMLHVLKVTNCTKTIGEAWFRFYFDEESGDRNIFIPSLSNNTISGGTREFSNIGTALLDVIKEIAKKFKVAKVCLTARTPCETPVPDNNNLVLFYQKKGFVVEGDSGNDFIGYRMVFKVSC